MARAKGRRKPGGGSLVAVRNAMRPFFNQRKAGQRWQQFQTVRMTADLKDLSGLYSLTEENSFYPFQGLGNTFPRAQEAVPDIWLKRLSPLPLQRELLLQIGRLNHHARPLVQALHSLSAINKAVLNGQWEYADQLLEAHRLEYGFSLTWAKKRILVSYQRGGLSAASRQYKVLTEGADRRAWAVFCHIYYDIVDPAYHPFKSVSNWLGALRSRPEDSRWFVDIALWQLEGFADSESRLSGALLRTGGASLLDLCFCVWTAATLHPTLVKPDVIRANLDPGLHDVLQESFLEGRIPAAKAYTKSGGPFSDIDLFRLSYFLDDIASVAKWKSELTTMLFHGRSQQQGSLGYTGSFLSRAAEAMHSEETGLRESETLVSEWLKNAATYPLEIDQSFTFAVVIAAFLRSIGLSHTLSSHYLVSLIARSNDIQDHLNPEDLACLVTLKASSTDRLLDFFLRDIIFRRVRSLDNDLERRTAFMDLIPSYDRASLIPYLDEVASWSLSAASHLARCSTRTFLERLYMIMTSVKDVLEERINVCKWLIRHDVSTSETLNEELTALQRELANLDARSDIDSTRVHVDEEGLREWFLETQFPQAARYVQTVLAEGENANHGSFLTYYNELLDKQREGAQDEFLEETQIGSEFILLDLVEKTLKAFVSDRSFGLNAYLSRRIRHGTLSGFLLTPMARIIRRANDAAAGSERTAAAEDLEVVRIVLESWRKRMAEELDHARKNVIQIASEEHPEGRITATWRVFSGVTHLDAMFSRVRSRVIETRGQYDILPDIFAVCWDLIERDLAQIRLYLARDFFRRINDALNEAFRGLTTDQQIVAFPFIKDLQEALESRVLEVCGWFVRPMFRRDSYDIRTLVDSMVSIIRDLDETYEFVPVINVDKKRTISRGTFELISDILFVLIGNAAKHGRRGGNVSVTSQLAEAWPPHLELIVGSEAADRDAFEKSAQRISTAMSTESSHEIETAAVAEGFTGIRKLMGLISRVKATRRTLEVRLNPDKLLIEFSVALPVEVEISRSVAA